MKKVQIAIEWFDSLTPMQVKRFSNKHLQGKIDITSEDKLKLFIEEECKRPNKAYKPVKWIYVPVDKDQREQLMEMIQKNEADWNLAGLPEDHPYRISMRRLRTQITKAFNHDINDKARKK